MAVPPRPIMATIDPNPNTPPSSYTSVGTGTVTVSSSAIPNYKPNYTQYPGAGGSGIPTNPFSVPTDGMIAHINGKVYRYSAGANVWHEVIDAQSTTTTEVPVVPIELDASAMLVALKQYKEFLEELDGLDQKHADVVSDTLFGLSEAIEALEKLE